MADEPDASSAFDLDALGHSLSKEQESSAEREAYLERLRQQIKAGEYTVDAEALAEKLLQSAAHEILPDHCPDDDDAAK
jgi:anti-sigma28 factor (negative regulator of flagellin synthesis)